FFGGLSGWNTPWIEESRQARLTVVVLFYLCRLMGQIHGHADDHRQRLHIQIFQSQDLQSCLSLQMHKSALCIFVALM
ncbi:unnamed protein product, partial [Urochloa humidicola]